jgi:large subunit ribosomal protein L17
MRHNIFGRQLSRTKNERRRLFQSLVRELIKHGTIRTSVAKAKAVRPIVDRLVTKAKKGTHQDIKGILSVLADKNLTQQLVEEGKTRFANRQSGFTRMIKLGARVGDAGEEVLLQFVDERVVVEAVKPANKSVAEKKEKATQPVKKETKPKEVVKPKVRKPRAKK